VVTRKTIFFVLRAALGNSNFDNKIAPEERGKFSESEEGIGEKVTMDVDESGGLFGIELGSEDESQVKDKDKVPRDFQSEKNFQIQRNEYKPRIEIGNVSYLDFTHLFYFQGG
jgi:hypothetical protein